MNFTLNWRHPTTAKTGFAFCGVKCKLGADEVGVKKVTYYGRNPILFSDPSNESWTQFCKRKIDE